MENSLRVHSSPTRCPFCHDLCHADGVDVVCHGCLARHHAECWRENQEVCAACSSPKALVAREAPATLSEQPVLPAAREELLQESELPRRLGMSTPQVESLVERQRLGRRLQIGGALSFAAALVLALVVLVAPDLLPRWIVYVFFLLCGLGVASLLLGASLSREPDPPHRSSDR